MANCGELQSFSAKFLKKINSNRRGDGLFLCEVLIGELVGIVEIETGGWPVRFGGLALCRFLGRLSHRRRCWARRAGVREAPMHEIAEGGAGTEGRNSMGFYSPRRWLLMLIAVTGRSVRAVGEV